MLNPLWIHGYISFLSPSKFLFFNTVRDLPKCFPKLAPKLNTQYFFFWFLNLPISIFINFFVSFCFCFFSFNFQECMVSGWGCIVVGGEGPGEERYRSSFAASVCMRLSLLPSPLYTLGLWVKDHMGEGLCGRTQCILSAITCGVSPEKSSIRMWGVKSDT